MYESSSLCAAWVARENKGLMKSIVSKIANAMNHSGTARCRRSSVRSLPAVAGLADPEAVVGAPSPKRCGSIFSRDNFGLTMKFVTGFAASDRIRLHSELFRPFSILACHGLTQIFTDTFSVFRLCLATVNQDEQVGRMN